MAEIREKYPIANKLTQRSSYTVISQHSVLCNINIAPIPLFSFSSKSVIGSLTDTKVVVFNEILSITWQTVLYDIILGPMLTHGSRRYVLVPCLILLVTYHQLGTGPWWEI